MKIINIFGSWITFVGSIISFGWVMSAETFLMKIFLFFLFLLVSYTFILWLTDLVKTK